MMQHRTYVGPCTPTQAGFTMIETLVSITLLVVAVAAPLTLASQSLASAYYARDQITAFHLAQEAIEVVRATRDGNILEQVTTGSGESLLSGVPDTTGNTFTVNTKTGEMTLCGSQCPLLQSDGTFYAYGTGGSWVDTRFRRSVWVEQVDGDDEVRVNVAVSWRTGVFQERSFTISANLYRWVEVGS